MKTKATVTQLPAVIVALLSGIVKDTAEKEAKATLPQGSKYEGEITVRIPYRVTKGEDYDVAPTVNLLSQAVLAKALVYSGVTADAYRVALLKAANEALTTDQTVAQVLSEDERVADAILKVQNEVVAQLPRQPRKGVVKVNILTDDGQPEIVSSSYTEV